MRKQSERSLAISTLIVVWCLVGIAGCGGNSNEAEFNNSAVPGIPSDRPDEKVSSRRERTRTLSKQEKKIEDRKKASEEKAAKKS